MSFAQRIDVEEREVTFVLGHLVARDLALDDAREDARHQRVISMISNLVLPAGVTTSATSPTALPSRPLPMGELTLILPTLMSDSLSATSVKCFCASVT